MSGPIKIRKRVITAINHYGDVCQCCGINNKAWLRVVSKEVRRGERVDTKYSYAWLEENGYPEGFMTLCYNCCHSWEEYECCPHVTNIYDPSYIRQKKRKDGQMSKAEHKRWWRAMQNDKFAAAYDEASKKCPDDPIGYMERCRNVKDPTAIRESRLDRLRQQADMLPTLSDMGFDPSAIEESRNPTWSELQAQGKVGMTKEEAEDRDREMGLLK